LLNNYSNLSVGKEVIMSVYEVIKYRKSIRKYTPNPIEQDKLEKILESARLAPSWKNKQCWHFIVVRDRNKINDIALRSGVISKINFFLKDAPVIIVACANPELSGHLNNQDYYLVDVAIALEHIVLTAADMGIGTCWIGAFNESKLKKILEIPENIRIVALSPLGYPAEKQGVYSKAIKMFAGSKNRKSLDDIVHWNKW